MNPSMAIVVTTTKVHCAVIPRGQTTSAPLTLDKEIKPHHHQFMLLSINQRLYLYGVTGTLPTKEVIVAVTDRWGERIDKSVVWLGQCSVDNPTQSVMELWILKTLTGDCDPKTLTRLTHIFPKDSDVNANA